MAVAAAVTGKLIDVRELSYCQMRRWRLSSPRWSKHLEPKSGSI
jgi:hypothetical protein